MELKSNILLTKVLSAVLFASLLVLLPSGAAASGDASISGVVTDASGRPVRGAVVKAASSGKTVARYTDDAGRFRIPGLQDGKYDVSVNAYGLKLETQSADAAQAQEMNFKLSPQNDVTRLTTADLRYLFPTSEEAYAVYSSCSTCHGFETVLTRRGLTAAAWQKFLPTMTVNRWGRNFFGDQERVAQLAHGLEQVFGPQGTLGKSSNPDLSKVKHTAVPDAALRATFTEYKIPSPRAMAHSVIVDEKSDTVWFSEYDAASNNMARFNPDTEKFEQFPIPVPKALAHTGAILKDGSYLVGMDRFEADGKVTGVDRNGNVVLYEFPGKPQGSRMVAVDPIRDDTVWLAAGDEVWRLNTKTKKFQPYKNPVPEKFPEGSFGSMTALPGQKPVGNGYAIAVDSKGFPWVTQLDLGIIFKLDPDTGKTTIFHTPEMRSARGLAIDGKDVVWFADYYGNKLGKLDPSTGQVKLYQPPTQNASPYGITVDFHRNYIWFTDTVGNNISRFDPKKEQFVEYALPTRNTSVRFTGIDSKGRIWYGGFWNGILGVIDPGDAGVEQSAISR